MPIHAFSPKGNGIGHWLRPEDSAQIKVEVPFAIPGDQVEALVKKKRRSQFSTQLTGISVPSNDRILPKCIHFGICGGCRWQQMTYTKQLEIKTSIVNSAFKELGPVQILPIVPCDPPWYYRNKMEFTFSNDSAGHRYLGLIMDSSQGKVLNLMECHLVNPWFIAVLKAIRLWWDEESASTSPLLAYHPYRNTGSLRTLTLREGQRTGERMVMLTVSGVPEFALHREQLERFVKALLPFKPNSEVLSIFLRVQQTAKGSITQFYEMLLHGPDHIKEKLHIQSDINKPSSELTFKISPSAFFQPNTQQAEKVYSLALQMADLPQGSIVYDLYCGTGILGICAAQKAKKVIGIELSPESALDARTNAKDNQIDNITIITGDVGKILADGIFPKKCGPESGQPLPKPDVILVDPPRMGLNQTAIDQILLLSPQKIIYISCNPTTQAANIAEFTSKGPYKVMIIRSVDQFPQTIHIENIVILQKELF